MNLQTVQILKKIVFAVIFGAVFWLLLELLQTTVINFRFDCCERCGNILFDDEQTILAFCAMLSFLAAALLKIKGWKGVFKTLAVSLVCFQIYFVLTKWSAFQSAECTALNYPRGSLPFLNELVMQTFSGVWAIICAAGLMIYQVFRSLLSRNPK